MTAILDAILNISKRSMMPEWHQLDSSSTMPQQQESIKKKTLKSSSRSFWFSTRLSDNVPGRIFKKTLILKKPAEDNKSMNNYYPAYKELIVELCATKTSDVC